MKNYLGQKIKNSNGEEYLVLGCMTSKSGFEKALLQLVRVEGSVKFIEYVIVRDYDFDSSSWVFGKYYTVFGGRYTDDVYLEIAEKQLEMALSDYLAL